MASPTKVKLTVNVKNAKGKIEKELIEMPVAQAEKLLNNPKRDKSWKLADDKFTLKNGNITGK